MTDEWEPDVAGLDGLATGQTVPLSALLGDRGHVHRWETWDIDDNDYHHSKVVCPDHRPPLVKPALPGDRDAQVAGIAEVLATTGVDPGTDTCVLDDHHDAIFAAILVDAGLRVEAPQGGLSDDLHPRHPHPPWSGCGAARRPVEHPPERMISAAGSSMSSAEPRHDPSDHDCKGGVRGDKYPLSAATPEPLSAEEEAALREALAFWNESRYTYGDEASFYRTSHNRAESHYVATVTPTRLARLLATLDAARSDTVARVATLDVERLAEAMIASDHAMRDPVGRNRSRTRLYWRDLAESVIAAMKP